MNLSSLHLVISLTVSLLPVISFLLALILLDSFKLVRPRTVALSILFGSAMAIASLFISVGTFKAVPIDKTIHTRYVAPVVEECLKALLVIFFIRTKRVGFMVDAAIHGFAIGAGFAIVENLYYFKVRPDPTLSLWIIRGLGTALMHGGAAAIVGILSKQMSDRKLKNRMYVYGPGVGLAILIHSFYNHFFVAPDLSVLFIIVGLPLLVVLVFHNSEKATREWLDVSLDSDALLLGMINDGKVSESRVGDYLRSLKSTFSPEIVADMLCLVRLHLELSIQAKGIILLREAGMPVPPDPEMDERFAELEYLEKSIGKTGLRAIAPIYHISDHDLWQLHLLAKQKARAG